MDLNVYACGQHWSGSKISACQSLGQGLSSVRFKSQVPYTLCDFTWMFVFHCRKMLVADFDTRRQFSPSKEVKSLCAEFNTLDYS